MEKQHNRGQDGAGIATVKLNTEPGYPFLHRLRSSANQPIADLFYQIGKEIEEIEKRLKAKQELVNPKKKSKSKKKDKEKKKQKKK